MNVLYSSSKQMEKQTTVLFLKDTWNHTEVPSAQRALESGIHKEIGGQDTASAEAQPDLLENWNIVSKYPRSWCFATVRTVAVSLGIGLLLLSM